MISAFIFARGGSKGVKKKNLRICGGITLLERAIRCARQSKYIDTVTVSTDSQEIAFHAKETGASVLMRPDELALDESPEWLSWQHAVKKSPAMEVFVSIPCTSPLRIPGDIDRTIMALDIDWQHPPFDAAITVVQSRSYIFGEASKRRQDKAVTYEVAGSCYALRPAFIMRAKSLWECDVAQVEIPRERMLDIDTEHDLRVADLILTHGA